jgi:hypothetical protein
MPLLINNPDSSRQRVTDIGISPLAGQRLRWDNAGWSQGGESGSLVVPVIVDEPGDVAGMYVVCEAHSGSTLAWALTYETDGVANWRFALRIARNTPIILGGNIGFNPTGRVCAIAISWERNAGGAGASVWRLSTFVPGMASTNRTDATGISASFAGPLTAFTVGHYRLDIPTAKANMRGSFILWALRASEMQNRLVADGAPLSSGLTSADVRSLVFPTDQPIDLCGPPAAYPAAVFLGLNHSCSGRLWNGYSDCRPGRIEPTCSVFDRESPIFGAYWNRAGGGRFTGSPIHINPYAHAGLTVLPLPINLSIAPGITAPFTAQGPIGHVGPAASRLVALCTGRNDPGQLRVLFAANSRAVTPGGPAELELGDATRTGRTLYCTYPETGIPSFPPIWNGKLVGYVNMPVPTGLYGYGANQEEGSADAPEPLYGPDCSVERPLCRRLSTGEGVSVKVATTRMIDSSYTRAWVGSRYATPVTGVQARFQGNGSPRRVNVGYDYRMLVRPEAGMPLSESLEVGFYLLRNPRASSYWIGKEAAASQGAPTAYAGPRLLVTSDLDARNVASERVISFSDPLMSSDTQTEQDGWFTIRNRSGLMTPEHVGQWLEVTDQNSVCRDLVCISGIDNTNPEECRVLYEGVVRNAPSINFDQVHWLKTPAPRYRAMTVRFEPGEAQGWRGLSVGVSSWAIGGGAILLGAHFCNPDRPGLMVGQVARSGAGFMFQENRSFHAVTPSLNTSPFDEMAQLLEPDVVVFCTADQGDELFVADSVRSKLRDYVLRWQAASAGLEAVLYSTGPEFISEVQHKYDEDAKVSLHVAYRQVAEDLDIPHTSLYYDRTAGTGCMNSHLTGENTESRTHPSTAFDVRRIIDQLGTLIARDCPADFNRDGGVDGADVSAFYAAWELGDPAADVNRDGGVDGADVEEFFRRWEAGGC